MLVVYLLVVVAALLGGEADKIDTLATACGSTLHCIRSPAGCTIRDDCDAAAGYAVVDGVLEVEFYMNISTTASQWVALGFSEDGLEMDKCKAVACVPAATGAEWNEAYYYMNDKTPEKLPSAGDTSMGVSEVVDGLLYCKVGQKLVPALNGDKGVKLTESNFTIILAYGEFDLAADLKAHAAHPVGSNTPVDVTNGTYGELNAPEAEETEGSAVSLRFPALLILVSICLTTK